MILILLFTARVFAAPLSFVGVTGDGQACRVKYAPKEFDVAGVVVEGHYTENNEGFSGRFNGAKRKIDEFMDRYEVYRKHVESTPPLTYSPEPKTEKLDGPLRMGQTQEHILTGGYLGAWGGGTSTEAVAGKRERWMFWTVGGRLDEPTRAILVYRVTQMNEYFVTKTIYTRTIDCQQLKAAPKSEREI